MNDYEGKRTVKQTIMTVAKSQFALHGYDGFTMRTLARDCEISLSSSYHYFKDKDSLLHEIFHQTSTKLGALRKKILPASSASQALRERIIFQFENAESILFILRYYLHFRADFRKQQRGFLDDKAYLHIKEVLEMGVENGEFNAVKSIDEDAKVIAHSINGFVLEYFPELPEKDEYLEVVDSIHSFLVSSLTNNVKNK